MLKINENLENTTKNRKKTGKNKKAWKNVAEKFQNFRINQKKNCLQKISLKLKKFHINLKETFLGKIKKNKERGKRQEKN